MRARTSALLKYCVCALLFASAVSAADPALLDLIPAGTGVVIGINVQQISSTRFGQEIYRQILARDNFSKLSSTRGLDILRSISEVLIVAPTNNQRDRGVFMLRGAFDVNTLESLAIGAAESSYLGVRIYTKAQAKKPLSIAVLDPTLVLGGDPQTLRSALARRSLPGSPDPLLMAKARELGETHDVWLVARASLADLARRSPQPQLGTLAGTLEKSIQQLSAGFKFGPMLQISMDLATQTDRDAAAMADALKMVITMMASGRNAPQMKPVLDALQLRTEGNTVKLNIAIPEDQLLASMQPAVTGTGRPDVAFEVFTPGNAGQVNQSSPGGTGVVTLPGPKPK